LTWIANHAFLVDARSWATARVVLDSSMLVSFGAQELAQQRT
jgi:hypothetical protein